MNKKVFVSGCYDMLHSGHVAFFAEAATHGDLYVGLGSDKTITRLKGRKTINTDLERLYMVKALRSVKDAWINAGSGLMDFEKELRELRPEIFFVNEDGYTPDKQKLCKDLGIELMGSKRVPHQGLPTRSTTAIRKECLYAFLCREPSGNKICELVEGRTEGTDRERRDRIIWLAVLRWH